MISRNSAVQSLLSLSKPLNELRQDLASFEWDYDGQPVQLERQHIVGALSKYVSGLLAEGDIEEWANLIEGREDISFDRDETLLSNVIYELANPDLVESLSHERARKIIELLK